MTPFNLEAALKGAEVVTRAGRPARLISYEPALDPLFRLVWADSTSVWCTDEHGRYIEGSGGDVFMDVTRESPMTPFDLEAALKGTEVATRAGRPARLISYEPDLDPWFRLVWTNNTDVWCTDKHGRCGEGISDNDMFMCFHKKVVWLNLYQQPWQNGYSVISHATESEADMNATAERIGRAIRVEL